MEYIGKFYGRLVFCGHLVYFIVNWYFFPALVFCTKKNLAALKRRRTWQRLNFAAPNWKIPPFFEVSSLASKSVFQLCRSAISAFISSNYLVKFSRGLAREANTPKKVNS
jgi:hypothetical protein